jgi:hypothetical protein
MSVRRDAERGGLGSGPRSAKARSQVGLSNGAFDRGVSGLGELCTRPHKNLRHWVCRVSRNGT